MNLTAAFVGEQLLYSKILSRRGSAAVVGDMEGMTLEVAEGSSALLLEQDRSSREAKGMVAPEMDQ